MFQKISSRFYSGDLSIIGSQEKKEFTLYAKSGMYYHYDSYN